MVQTSYTRNESCSRSSQAFPVERTIPIQMTSHKLVFIMLEFDDIEYSALSDLDLYVVVWLNLLLHMYNIYVGNKDRKSVV